LARAGKYDITKPVGRVNKLRHNNKRLFEFGEKRFGLPNGFEWFKIGCTYWEKMKVEEAEKLPVTVRG